MNKSKISAYDLTNAPLFSIFPFHTMRIGSKPRSRDDTLSTWQYFLSNPMEDKHRTQRQHPLVHQRAMQKDVVRSSEWSLSLVGAVPSVGWTRDECVLE